LDIPILWSLLVAILVVVGILLVLWKRPAAGAYRNN
jgi:hypothetical protein